MALGKKTKVFTIGHSTLALDIFMNLLTNAGITAIADVRSSPFSRRFPHFNRDDLRISLKESGIKYVFLGNELGGRPRSGTLYCDGIADYEKMAMESTFIKGLNRVVDGSHEHSIALMCSEHNPLDCHRCLLVGRALAARNISLCHILSTGKIVTQHDIEEKLLELSGVVDKNTNDMFSNREDLLSAAYKLRSIAVAYREPTRDLAETNTSHWNNHDI